VTPARRPGIYRVGHATIEGDTLHLHGWGLTWCQARCRCHAGPFGQLRIAQNHTTGTLGLVTYRPGCYCCTPWTVDELVAIVRDLAHIATVETA
jgi:hypothetical protein